MSDSDEPLQFYRYETCLRNLLSKKNGDCYIRRRHDRDFRKADASPWLYTNS